MTVEPISLGAAIVLLIAAVVVQIVYDLGYRMTVVTLAPGAACFLLSLELGGGEPLSFHTAAIAALGGLVFSAAAGMRPFLSRWLAGLFRPTQNDD